VKGFLVRCPWKGLNQIPGGGLHVSGTATQ